MKPPDDVRIRIDGLREVELQLELLLRARAKAECVAEEARRELDRVDLALRRVEKELARRGS